MCNCLVQRADFYRVSSRGRNQTVGQPPQIFILSLDYKQAIWETLHLIFVCALFYTRQNAPFLTEIKYKMLIFPIAYWVRDILVALFFETQAYYWPLNYRTWEREVIPYGTLILLGWWTQKRGESALRETWGLDSHPHFLALRQNKFCLCIFLSSLCAFLRWCFIVLLLLNWYCKSLPIVKLEKEISPLASVTYVSRS